MYVSLFALCKHAIFFLPLFFAGCLHNTQYHPHRLKPLSITTSTTTERRQGVTVFGKQLSQEEIKYYFNDKKLRAMPIQLSILNSSATTWHLDKKDVGLPLIPTIEVSRFMQQGIVKSANIGLFIPVVGVFHGVACHHAAHEVRQDLVAKSLEKRRSIGPYEKIDLLVFVEASTPVDDFEVMLKNDRNETITFNMGA